MLISLLPSHLVFNNQRQAADDVHVSASPHFLSNNQQQAADNIHVSAPISSSTPLVGNRRCQCLCTHHILSSTLIGKQQTMSMSLLLHVLPSTTNCRQQAMPMSLLQSHLTLHLICNNQRQAAENINVSAPISSPLEKSAAGSRRCRCLCSLHILSSTAIGRQQTMSMSLLLSQLVFNNHW